MGFLIGLWVMVKLVRKERLSTFLIFRHLLGIVVMSLVGGYIGHLLLGVESHMRFNWVSAIPWASGFALFGVLGAGCLYFRLIMKDDMKLLGKYMDCFSLAALVGLVFGYVGWFMGGRGLGPYTEISWLQWSKIESIDISITGAVHPLGLYMAAGCFVLFLFLMWLRSRKPPVGTIFWVGLFFYSAMVAGVEQVRLVEDSLYWWGEWNLNQILALLLLVLSMFGIYRSQHQKT